MSSQTPKHPTFEEARIPLMVVALSPMALMCRDRAREAHQGAAVATTRKLRGFWDEMERRWLVLAEGYEIPHVMHSFVRNRRNERMH
jgi:hypothetical protein